MPELVVEDRRVGPDPCSLAAVADLEEELSVQGKRRLRVVENRLLQAAPFAHRVRKQLHAIDQSGARKAQPPVEIASPDRLARGEQAKSQPGHTGDQRRRDDVGPRGVFQKVVEAQFEDSVTVGDANDMPGSSRRHCAAPLSSAAGATILRTSTRLRIIPLSSMNCMSSSRARKSLLFRRCVKCDQS